MTEYTMFSYLTKQSSSLCARSIAVLTTIFVLSGLMAVSSCSNDDASAESTEVVLADGEWTGMPVSLDTPPFYAVRVSPAIHHTMGGLSVNTQTQVLRADGTPIVGLYAAGEVTGGLHGANRLGGNGVADIVVNGRLAGLAASEHLK